MKRCLTCLFVTTLGFSTVFGQEKPVIHVYAKKQKGVGFVTADSTFSLNYQFRIQNRALFTSKSDSDLAAESFEFRVRRLRMKFQGFAFSPKLTYYIQLSFSRGDMDWRSTDGSTVNTSPNVVRDAVIYYSPNKYWRFGLGQTKLPGNRQRVVSSGDLQFYDRSIVNARFNIDRDFGFFGQFNSHYVILKGTVSSGEGRNAELSNNGLAYTGRVEFLPFGAFTGENDIVEGDQAREAKPKLSIAATFSQNDKAVRQAGQLGNDLYEPRTLTTFEADILFKYKGFSWYNELNSRNTQNPVTVNGNAATRVVYVGYGLLSQASYLFKNNWEIAGRFASTAPSSKLYYNAALPSLNEKKAEAYELGVTKYFNGHRVKLQFGLVYNKLTDLRTNDYFDGFWNGGVQMELGI